MKICYEPKRFSEEHFLVISMANEIVREYEDQGFSLTLRQLYYQFVARDLLANKQTEYKRLGGIVSAARRAGLLDWSAIEDRTRFVRENPSWDDEEALIAACAEQFNIDMWANQTHRPEVWIEKDALIGVIEEICSELEVPFFSCRGYPSDSEVWRAGQRFRQAYREGQIPLVIHLGDHDPSGIDMTRDIGRRLSLFAETNVEVDRIALNMDQVREHNPPPNPAKMSDARAKGYVVNFGHDSWELDALEPKLMADLIRDSIYSIRDIDSWDELFQRREEGRAAILSVAENWSDVKGWLA